MFEDSLGGGFKYVWFSPRSLGKSSNVTSIFFQTGWNHQLDSVSVGFSPLGLILCPLDLPHSHLQVRCQWPWKVTDPLDPFLGKCLPLRSHYVCNLKVRVIGKIWNWWYPWDGLTINPLYTLYSGYLLGISPFKRFHHFPYDRVQFRSWFHNAQ